MAPDTVDHYGDERYYDHWPNDSSGFRAGNLKLRTFGVCIDRLLSAHNPTGSTLRLLDVGCAQGQMLEAARRRGLEPVGIEISGAGREAANRGFRVYGCRLEDAPLTPGSFDFVTMIDVVEHIRRPQSTLERARQLLRAGGLLLLLTPDVGSLSARVLGARWPHYKAEHVVYFTRRSIRELLARCGFRPVIVRPALKFLSLDYVLGDLRRYGEVSRIDRFSAAEHLVPRALRQGPLPVPSDLGIVARAVG